MLVTLTTRPTRLPLEGAQIDYWPEAIEKARADRWQCSLTREIQFAPETLKMFGREVAVPRLVAWHADEGVEYAYSGRNHQPAPWTMTLEEIRRWLLGSVGVRFNSVLCNLYRDGRDAMGWHADDERELGQAPVIASVSLGASRRFGLRSRQQPRRFHRLELAHGSLLLMSGQTQSQWQHCVYRTATPTAPRINLTFRTVLSSDVVGAGARYNERN